MTIHKVRKPFYCRMDQFASKGFPGQILVVGIAKDALTDFVYRMKIGNSKTIYQAKTSEIVSTAFAWRNPRGKLVLITPVDLFEKIVDTDVVKK